MIRIRLIALVILMLPLALAACVSRAAPQQTEAAAAAQSEAANPETSEAAQVKDKKEAPEYYRFLVDEKAALAELARDRVKAYKLGMPPENPNHHPVYPDDFPPVSELRDIESENDFAVRFTGNIDALGGIYLAVPIDGEHELHMTASRYQDESGSLLWGSGDTFFVKISEISWELQDIDLYAN